eukprot:2263270-Amphidinium_carterae.3
MRAQHGSRLLHVARQLRRSPERQAAPGCPPMLQESLPAAAAFAAAIPLDRPWEGASFSSQEADGRMRHQAALREHHFRLQPW